MGDENYVWRPSKEKYGVAVCNFSGDVKHGLPLSTGDTVHILEVYSENEPIWYRGCSLKVKNKVGIFPAAFICTKQCKVDNEGPYESITPIEDQTSLEVSYVLREWSVLWKEAFVMNIYSCNTQLHVHKRRKSIFYVSDSRLFQDQKGMWYSLHNIMMDLISMRRTLLADTQTQDNCQELKMKITRKIDWGNKTLSLDLVPRLNGEQVDADKISIVQLYRIHKESDSSLRDVKTSKYDRESNDGRMLNIANILVNFKTFPSSLSEDKELYFSIYDASELKFISERFLVSINDQGMTQPIEKLNNCYGLFLDLPLEKDLWLVVQIYRIGKMLTSDTSKKSSSNKRFRRPYGAAVCSLKEINQAKFSHDETEVTLKVTSVDKEELFHNLHDTIIRRALQRIPTSEKNLSGIHNLLSSDSYFPNLRNRSFKNSDQSQGKIPFAGLISKQRLYIGLQLLFGDLPFLKSTNPIPFNKGVALVQQCSFPESLLPGDIRNDLYIVLSHGEFERGNKTSAKNVEVTMKAFDSIGELIPDCIYRGIGEPPSSYYHSTVFYHSNNPKWKETVKFTLPIEKFTGAHIRLELRHCSTSDKKQGDNLLGFSFIKITNQDITLTDATHTLCIYKCDTLVNLTCMDYLNLPQSPSETSLSSVSAIYQRNSRDTLTISSCLCSTKFTQNKDLLDILQWRMKTDKIEQSLEKLMSINGRDIVRYLHDILDALFDMFYTESLEQYNQVVFDALVHVFYLLTNRTFKQYVPGFQSYLTDTFSSSLVYRHLLLCLKGNLDKIINGSQDRILKEMLKVFNYLFQFIVQSKLLFNRAYTVERSDDFPQLIYLVFEKMGYLVSLNQDNLSSCQILLLSNIPNTYNSLLKLLSKKDVTIYVVNIINFMPKELSESLFSKKLEFLHETLKSELVTDRDSRMMLLPLCMSQIKRCFIAKQLYSLATTILGDILCFLHSLKLKDPDSVSEEIRIVITAIFQVVLRAIDVYDISGAVVSCFVEMLRIMDDDHYTALFQAYAQGIPLREFLNMVLVTFHNLINFDTFPCDWSVMRMVMNNVILTSIHYFARALSDNFLLDSNFEYQLWNNYFHLAVSFIIQPSLQLENFSIAKSQKIKERYQDMRVLLGFQVQTLWQDLEDYKFHFIPYLVGPFLEVTLVPDKELRKATLPILFDMMECEMKLSKSFMKVEKEMFEKLDLFITNNKGDTEYKELFHDILMEKVQAEPSLQQSGSQFILSISNLMEKLLDYRQYIDKEDNKDKRMHCTYNILNFYKTEVNKEELYIRYIHKLYELHLNTDSFVEAGLTLQLYSSLLDWTENPLPTEINYHSELQWERKERLYLDIIDCFDKGKAWEYGIPLCKELACHYETKLYDYRKLSEILQKEAKFFENILDGQFLRQDPSYYRVAYFGQTFPKFLRNKVFIYRGDEYLKLQMIMSHLTTEFPNATILIHNNPPDDTMKQGDQQYIQISCVKPFKVDQGELSNPSIPREVKSFYQVNEVDTFLYDRPYHRGEKDKNNEFKTLCIERSIIKTVEKLPGILRWYEVESIDVENLTPIEGAIDLMKQVTKDLIIQIEKCQIKPTSELTLLSMKLRGTINATVNGGIAKYQEAFFTQEFAAKYPDELNHLEELKAVMLRQLQVLENGLTLHGNHVTDAILPLHKTMEENLVILKKNIKHAITGSPSFGRMHQTPSNRLDLFEDRPSTPSTGSIHSNSSNRSSTLSADTGFHDEDNSFNIYSEMKEESELPTLPDKQRSLKLPVPLPPQLPKRSRPHSFVATGSSLIQFKKPVEPSKTPSPSPGAVSLPTTPLDQKTSARRVSESEIHHKFSPPPLPHRQPLAEDSKLKASPNGPPLQAPPVVPPKTPKVIDMSKITAPPPLPPRKTFPTTPITPEVPSSEYRLDKAPPLPRRLNNI
ncbi:dedicator of cytokinesis protein 3 isoform X2 [Octopus bimaculoides]|nr:dedicator of cytokinesis protein 3 isoform X2 [Octopus bimaculoides]|eukprot:XP_014772011.1 PREDICTED: dedicator of cytokinesis protein 3-like isoform X2 [Octopus bimaculoides]